MGVITQRKCIDKCITHYKKEQHDVENKTHPRGFGGKISTLLGVLIRENQQLATETIINIKDISIGSTCTVLTEKLRQTLCLMGDQTAALSAVIDNGFQ